MNYLLIVTAKVNLIPLQYACEVYLQKREKEKTSHDRPLPTYVHGWFACMRVLVSCPDPTLSHKEKGLVFFKQFLGLSGKPIIVIACDLEK